MNNKTSTTKFSQTSRTNTNNNNPNNKNNTFLNSSTSQFNQSVRTNLSNSTKEERIKEFQKSRFIPSSTMNQPNNKVFNYYNYNQEELKKLNKKSLEEDPNKKIGNVLKKSFSPMELYVKEMEIDPNPKKNAKKMSKYQSNQIKLSSLLDDDKNKNKKKINIDEKYIQGTIDLFHENYKMLDKIENDIKKSKYLYEGGGMPDYGNYEYEYANNNINYKDNNIYNNNKKYDFHFDDDDVNLYNNVNNYGINNNNGNNNNGNKGGNKKESKFVNNEQKDLKDFIKQQREKNKGKNMDINTNNNFMVEKGNNNNFDNKYDQEIYLEDNEINTNTNTKKPTVKNNNNNNNNNNKPKTNNNKPINNNNNNKPKINNNNNINININMNSNNNFNLNDYKILENKSPNNKSTKKTNTNKKTTLKQKKQTHFNNIRNMDKETKYKMAEFDLKQSQINCEKALQLVDNVDEILRKNNLDSDKQQEQEEKDKKNKLKNKNKTKIAANKAQQFLDEIKQTVDIRNFDISKLPTEDRKLLERNQRYLNNLQKEKDQYFLRTTINNSMDRFKYKNNPMFNSTNMRMTGNNYNNYNNYGGGEELITSWNF